MLAKCNLHIFFFIFQLCYTVMRILLYARPQKYTWPALVYTTVFYASLLYQLQHQFSIVCNVWYHVSTLFTAIVTQNIEKHDQISLQSATIHIEIIETIFGQSYKNHNFRKRDMNSVTWLSWRFSHVVKYTTSTISRM